MNAIWFKTEKTISTPAWKSEKMPNYWSTLSQYPPLPPVTAAWSDFSDMTALLVAAVPCSAGGRVELRVKTQLRFFIGGHSSPALTPPPGRTREFKSHGGARFQTFNWREIFIFYLHRGGRTDRVKCGIDFQHDPIYNLDFMMKRFTKAIRKDLLTRV